VFFCLLKGGEYHIEHYAGGHERWALFLPWSGQEDGYYCHDQADITADVSLANQFFTRVDDKNGYQQGQNKAKVGLQFDKPRFGHDWIVT
jgi:hypothetical protein